MVAELTKAFQEPSTGSKVRDAASAYKVLAKLYTALFKTPKVKEEMVKQVRNIRSLAINRDLHRALETSFEVSMASSCLDWHMTVMINYLYTIIGSHCQADPILKAPCNHLHGAIRESRLTSAQAASVAIAAQCHMILDASTFRDCGPLRATLLFIPFVGSSLFGGQFQPSVEEATHSQEKLSQVRQLAMYGSWPAQGTSGSRATHNHRSIWLLPLLLPLQPLSRFLRGMEVWLPNGAGGLAAKRRRCKNRGGNRRSGSGSAGCRGQGVSNKRPPAIRRWCLIPIIPSYPTHFGRGGGWVVLSQYSWPGVGYTAWDITERSLPCGGQAVVFPASLAMDNLGPVCPLGDPIGVFPPFCESTPFIYVSCGDSIAVQMISTVARGFVLPKQGGRGACRFVVGPGWGGGGGGGGCYSHYFLATKPVHWWVLPDPQPLRTQHVYLSCQVPHGDPHLYSAGSWQGLVDGVAGSQGCLSACADTPQSLLVSSVCSQEPGRGAHCLSMETKSPFWLLHCPQSFCQTLGSCSSILASAGMSDVSVHWRHHSCTGVRHPGSAHSRHLAWFYHKPPEVSPHPISTWELWSTRPGDCFFNPQLGWRRLYMQLRACWAYLRSLLYASVRWQGFWHLATLWFPCACFVFIPCPIPWKITSTWGWIALQSSSSYCLRWSGQLWNFVHFRNMCPRASLFNPFLPLTF